MTQSFPSVLAMWLVALFLVHIALFTVQASRTEDEGELIQRLRSFNRLDTMPSGSVGGGEGGEGEEEEGPLKVKMTFYLIDVVNANLATNEVDLVVWTVLSWTDKRLSWGTGFTRQFQNISAINVPKKKVWIPDVVPLSTSAPDEPLHPGLKEELKVYQSGNVNYYQAKRIRVLCELSGLNSESGTQCRVKYSSWMNTGDRLDLGFTNGNNTTDGSLEMMEYVPISKFEVTAVSGIRSVVHFTCCPGEPYIDLRYYITIRNKNRS